MKPPIGGPITGPSIEGMVSTDIARTRSCLGVVRSSTRRPTGPISAPAAPSATRASSSSGRLVAKPQAAQEAA